MKNRNISRLLAAIVGLCAILAVPGVRAMAQDAQTTEDIVYMSDGRILHGKVLEETPTTIVFNYVNETLDITTKLTLQKDNISKIDHDVAKAGVTDPAPEKKGTSSDASSPAQQPAKADPSYLDELESEYGAKLADNDSKLPGVYVIPMRGQMGTDVQIDFYKGLVDDIRASKPDLIVFQLDCSDADDGFLMTADERIINGDYKPEPGIFDLDQYSELVDLFHDQLGDIQQVMWVKDSVGISSVIALAWKECYMAPDAFLTGLRQIWQQAASWSDPQVRAKMVAAWSAAAKAFLEYGQHPLEVGDAMLDPTKKLSASWRGREVIWSLEGKGQYIVDDSDKQTVGFDAKSAEDLALTNGTAGTLDDLMLLHGYREYRLIPGAAEREFNNYVENWRRVYEGAVQSLKDYNKHMSWASGNQALQNLGRAKTDMQRVLAAIKRYDAVRVRLEQLGWDEFSVQAVIIQITEQIRRLRQSGAGGAGGGGRGGAGDGPRGG